MKEYAVYRWTITRFGYRWLQVSEPSSFEIAEQYAHRYFDAHPFVTLRVLKVDSGNFIDFWQVN